MKTGRATGSLKPGRYSPWQAELTRVGIMGVESFHGFLRSFVHIRFLPYTKPPLWVPWWSICVAKVSAKIGWAQWLMPLIPALWVGASLEVRSSRPAWPTWWNPVSTINTKISQVWWCAHVIPATREAEAGELLEPRRQRLWWAEIMPLHSSLGNKSETQSQKKKKKELILSFTLSLCWDIILEFTLWTLWVLRPLNCRSWDFSVSITAWANYL